MRTLPVAGSDLSISSTFRANDSKDKKVETVVKEDNKQASKTPLLTTALALASLGVATFAVVRRPSSAMADEAANAAKKTAEEAKQQLTKLGEDISKVIKSQEDSAAGTNALEKHIEKVEKTVNENAISQKQDLRALSGRVDKLSTVHVVDGLQEERNLVAVDGLRLMQNLRNNGESIELPDKVIEKLKNAAANNIKGENKPPKLGKDSCVWSLTAESLPEKEGGLGEVPAQIGKNLTKELGIDNFLVRPLNEIPGVSRLVERDGKYFYWHKGWGKEESVEKVMDFEVKVFRNGKYESQPVEVFYGMDPKMGHKRLMFRNNTYFGANGLYNDTQAATESERYAFFAKAVYEFMKIKADPKSATHFKIPNTELYRSIKGPDAMILNDWHAASMAGLMRLLAPVEASQGELSSTFANKFEKMNLLNIVHNADYQGASWNHASDVINTLFGKYAKDIYLHAGTGFTDKGFEPISKVLTVDGGANLANMGAALSTKVKPVSPTYAKELAEQFERSRALQHVFDERIKAGTMAGQSNGWDRAVNEVSEANVISFNNNLNKDKFDLIKLLLGKLEGLSSQEQAKIQDFLNKKSFSFKTFDSIITSLRGFNIPAVNTLLADLEAQGVTNLRSFKPLVAGDDINLIMENRKYNKQILLDYLKSMVELSKKYPEAFNIREAGLTDISNVDPAKLDEIPILSMGARFCDQKGIDIVAQTVEKLFKDWGKLHEGKEKPIFVVGGADPTGEYKQMMLELKKKLGEDGDRLLYMDGYTPNNILQTGSDFSLFPSHFEPDGSKWESLYKGTPVICTRVGGHVDSVSDNVNGILTKHTVPEVNTIVKENLNKFDKALDAKLKDKLKDEPKTYLEGMVADYFEATQRALGLFYDNKPEYQNMVRKAIDGDQSWLIKNAEGKITGGSLLGHLEDLGFNLKDFPQIAA